MTPTISPPRVRVLQSLNRLWVWLCIALAAASWPAQAINPEDLLHPDQAFRPSAEATAADMLRVEWRIADGYYLYRDKIRFSSDDPTLQFAAPLLPEPTEIKHDEFFGETAVYRGRLTIDVPVAQRGDSAADFALKLHSQGCADAGVCFAPHIQQVSISLPAVPGADTGSNAGGGLDSFFSSVKQRFGLGGQKEDFLEPDQAFQLLTEVRDANTLQASWQIADHYYLYRDKIAFTIKDADGVHLAAYTSPPGEMKTDESFGLSEVYYRQVSIALPLLRDNNAAQALTLEARYQGCADAGLCYAPITKAVALTLPPRSEDAAAVVTSSDPFISEQDRYAQSLLSGNLALTLLGFFGVGLLLAFTPCVFPMVPILSSLIIGQGAAMTTGKAFRLSLAYVLAMALTYTVAGVLAGLFGANLQAAFQNPWIIGAFSAVFVALALSMFGFYELQLPASWQTKLSELSNRQQGGTWMGAAVMGLLSALIVGPCVAAPLAGALIYISQTGDGALGGLALFALSMGMGAPLLAVGTSAGKWLPHASGWMNTIKAVFGVMMLALAIWMLDRVVPAAVSMALLGILLVVSAVYMGATDRLMPDATGWRKLWKGTGLVAMVYGGTLIIGATAGGGDILQPLRNVSFFGADADPERQELKFTSVKGLDGFQQALNQASVAGQPVMLDFYADWCVSCKEMEHYTFSDTTVQATLAGVTLLQADVTANDEQDQALLKHFGLFGPPSILFFDNDGAERRQYRLVGFMDATDFASHVQRTYRN